MKLVFLLNVIDFKIGGVMIMGDWGIGKFIVVCVLVDLLFIIEVIVDDLFNFDFKDFELMSNEICELI